MFAGVETEGIIELSERSLLGVTMTVNIKQIFSSEGTATYWSVKCEDVKLIRFIQEIAEQFDEEMNSPVGTPTDHIYLSLENSPQERPTTRRAQFLVSGVTELTILEFLLIRKIYYYVGLRGPC